MLGFDPPSDQRPITYFRGLPIHTATLLVIIHVAAFIVSAFLFALGGGGVLEALSFDTADLFGRFAVWQIVTYWFVHVPAEGIWFAIEMVLLFMFGREVEKFFGRRDFLRLYAGLLLVAPVALALASLAFGRMGLAGSRLLHFGVFIAFAALYPNAGIFFGIAAKWIAAVLLAIYTLQDLAYHSWSGLLALWVTTVSAILYVRHARGLFTFPSLSFLKPKPRFTVVRPEPPRRARSGPRPAPPAAEDRTAEEMDALLDKIGTQGINSLTTSERERLESLREAMLRRQQQSQ